MPTELSKRLDPLYTHCHLLQTHLFPLIVEAGAERHVCGVSKRGREEEECGRQENLKETPVRHQAAVHIYVFY